MGWRKTGGRYPKNSFGENALLALEYQIGGEGYRNEDNYKRAGHVRGGRKKKDGLAST